jgi:hypothetical protein
MSKEAIVRTIGVKKSFYVRQGPASMSLKVLTLKYLKGNTYP